MYNGNHVVSRLYSAHKEYLLKDKCIISRNMSSVNDKPIIGVIGATGLQGGGLVQAIVNDKDSPFRVRAFTRDPTKAASKELEALGAEVVALDLDKPDTLADAFQGLSGLYVVTKFVESTDIENESKQVQAIVEAGEKAGTIQHYVWSTLEDTTLFFDSLPAEERPPKIRGYYVPHFDIKGKSDKFFPAEKTTCMILPMYFENTYNYHLIRDGVMTNNLSTKPIPFISVDDIGPVAYGIFKAGDKYKGKTIGVAGDTLTLPDFMKVISEATGKEYKYQEIDRATFVSFGFPSVERLSNMFEFHKLNNKAFCETRSVSLAEELYPDIMNVQTWVKTHRNELINVGPK